MKKAIIKTTSDNTYIYCNIEDEEEFLKKCNTSIFVLVRKNFINNKNLCWLKTSSIESIEFILQSEN